MINMSHCSELLQRFGFDSMEIQQLRPVHYEFF